MHKKAGLDFEQAYYYYIQNGCVLSVAGEALVFAEPLEDHWFVYMAIGKNRLPYFISCLPFYKPYIKWARCLKTNDSIRCIETDRLIRAYEKRILANRFPIRLAPY